MYCITELHSLVIFVRGKALLSLSLSMTLTARTMGAKMTLFRYKRSVSSSTPIPTIGLMQVQLFNLLGCLRGAHAATVPPYPNLCSPICVASSGFALPRPSTQHPRPIVTTGFAECYLLCSPSTRRRCIASNRFSPCHLVWGSTQQSRSALCGTTEAALTRERHVVRWL